MVEIKKTTILLVEDDITTAMLEKKQLEGEGYTVLHVLTGEDAVNTALNSDTSIDLILMDINLGSGIDGTQAAGQILDTKEIPVVFLSSHTDPEIVEKTEKITSYGYVVKNSGITVLDASIKMAFKLFNAHQMLMLSEEKFRVAFTASPDSININALDGTYLDINEGFTELTGYTKDDVLGHSSLDIDIWAIPEDRKKLIEGLEAEGKIDNLESQFRCKDGSLKTALMTAHIIKIYSKPHILSITRDITKHKHAEEAIRDAKIFLDNMSDIAYTADNRGNILWVNSSVKNATGLTPAEVIGKPFLPLFIESDHASLIDVYRRTLKGESLENTLTFTTGVTCHFSSLPKYNDNGEIIGTFGIARDITEKKRNEEEIKHQLREKEILLREVNHRIKNNILSIENQLKLQYESISSKEIQAVLQETIGRIRSMRVLYEKLLFSADFRDNSVKNYLESLLDSIASIYPEKENVTIERHISDFTLESKKLFPLGIIINELFTNSMKYGFNDMDKGKITVSLNLSDKHATLTLQDNGTGLPEDFDISTSEGFGLMIVRMLSEQLKGSFRIESRNGTRSVLEFSI